MTGNESEIGGTPGCNYSDVETETHTHTQGGATSTTLAHAAESGPFSVPHECLRRATNLSCRTSSNKAERYMQKAPRGFIWGWVLSMLSGETCKTDGPVTAAPLTFN